MLSVNRARRAFLLVWASLLAPAHSDLVAQASQSPQTIPEKTGYAETSRAADVTTFIDKCVGLSHGDRLRVAVAGKSPDGRPILVVKVALPDNHNPDNDNDGRVRAIVIGNIHAGEVEGKEAVQELIREFAAGEHSQLLEQCDVWFVPIYNLDGNEAVKVGNRRGQNGPDAVGQRANGQGFDLNRDFVKAEAPETRALLKMFREFDPMLFVDLHTTNGSRHGYHLTYAPSLSPNLDQGIDRFGRQLLETSRREMRALGFEVFDYGNFETRDWDGGGAPRSRNGTRGWFTYDSRARYGVNYFGLRNRIGILSEAYSYADFKTRIAATRAFVLTLLEQMVANKHEAARVMREAHARIERAQADGPPVYFGSDTVFGAPEELPILVGKVERQGGEEGKPLRFVRVDEAKEEILPVARRFRARRQEALPRAWAITAPTTEVVDRLRWHGVAFQVLKKPKEWVVQRFEVTKKRKPKRPFQGHQELVLEGRWLQKERRELPLGTIVIPGEQSLARLCATLLEPRSEDSLSSWNFFEKQTGTHYPVMRVIE